MEMASSDNIPMKIEFEDDDDGGESADEMDQAAQVEELPDVIYVNRLPPPDKESPDSPDEGYTDYEFDSDLEEDFEDTVRDEEQIPENDDDKTPDIEVLFWRPPPIDLAEIAIARVKDYKRLDDDEEKNHELSEQALSGQIDFSHPFWSGLDDLSCQRATLFNGTRLCSSCNPDTPTGSGSFFRHGISLTTRADSRLCPRCRGTSFKMAHPLTCSVCLYQYFLHKEEIMAGHWLDLSHLTSSQ